MDNDFISEDVLREEITIDFTSNQIYEFKSGSRLDNKVFIESVSLNKELFNNVPYSSPVNVLKVSLSDSLDLNDSNLSFNLYCNTDEYFYAIQEDYFNFLEVEQKSNKNSEDYSNLERDKQSKNINLIDSISPRVELFEHFVFNETKEVNISKRKINYLLNYSQADKNKLKDHLERRDETKYLSLFFSEVSKAFYIVLNKFKKKNVTEEEKCGLSLISKPQKADETKKEIAVVVHGLASKISNKYDNLFNYLIKQNYWVYGFDYLTINERITDNGRLLAREINQLKQKHPDSEITIIAHSMGGLVSRSAYVEHNTSIDKIIMAGTPNSGSVLATAPMLGRKIFVRLIALIANNCFEMKQEDYRQLSNMCLNGLHDLASKSRVGKQSYISQLNSNDSLSHSKKYFSLVGNFNGMPHDIIVHGRNMISINDISMAHVTGEWSHFTYFAKNDLDSSVGKAIKYLI